MKQRILAYIDEAKKPVSIESIIDALFTSPKEKKHLRANTLELIAEGVLIVNRKNKIARPKDFNLFVGKIKKNSRGFGFLISDDENEKDIFISRKKLNGALNNDRVVVRKLKAPLIREEDNHDEGEVIRILKRDKTSFVGTVIRYKKQFFVTIDDNLVDFKVKLKNQKSLKCKKGDKVIVKITMWPDTFLANEAIGTLEKKIGNENDVGMDILSIIHQNNLATEFSEESLEELSRLEKIISKKDLDKRVDYRHLDIITIDGSDSKDLDDAVYVNKTDKGFYLSVHIADVGHYVR